MPLTFFNPLFVISFEHASHVTLSVLKLMSRFNDGENQEYSFTSDPLTRFACAFSALTHDVLHPGVPNAQLIKEDPEAGEHYKNKSVAEQRSFEVAWELLMEPKFQNLQKAIYSTPAEEARFRQLVINSIMATDVFDPELKQLRSDRWERAFSQINDSNHKLNVDRKATIVIEHLIQASDVSHTMQHWNVYRKWNQRLFEEMCQAYLDGRCSKDPSDFWYKGELAFFDHYIIPLARRLQQCGDYLGVSGHEYLDYAQKNRMEWEKKGEQVVEDMKSKCQKEHGETGLARSSK
jgi:hypothetical protein